MSGQRRHFGTDQKAAILKRYLVDKVPISDLCDEYGIKPNQIYAWQKILFDNAPAAFHPVAKREAKRLSAQEEEVARLRAKLVQKNEVISELMEENVRAKREWGTLNGRWVPHDTRDEVVDYVRRWNERTEIPARKFVAWLGIGQSKFHDWKDRYGKRNEHNGWVPRDWWLEDWEKQAIIRFSFEYPLEGYRRLAFMMLDRDVVAVSPSSVYRVLKAAGRIGRSTNKPSKKGTGFQQPQKPHEHWHIDISYLNIHGTFYYLTTILDGYSRYTVHWEIRRSMTEQDELTILQRAAGEVPQGDAADHQRQWVAVFGEGLQRVHSHLRDDARAHQPVLSAEQRQTGAISREHQGRVPAAGHADLAGGCHPHCGSLRGALQRGAIAQRDWLCGAGGQIGGP